MLEPDSTRVVPTHAGPPGGLDSPHALQILMTEHWSLLAARSLGYTEAMSRASIFIAALSGSVIALALVGQATDFGDGFVAFALVLLPVVYFLGVSTVARLGQNNYEDAVWIQGMNRIRHAYLELVPALVGIAALGLGLGTGGSLALGGIGFVSSLTGFILWARRSIATHVEQLVVRFPSPS